MSTRNEVYKKLHRDLHCDCGADFDLVFDATVDAVVKGANDLLIKALDDCTDEIIGCGNHLKKGEVLHAIRTKLRLWIEFLDQIKMSK